MYPFNEYSDALRASKWRRAKGCGRMIKYLVLAMIIWFSCGVCCVASVAIGG